MSGTPRSPHPISAEIQLSGKNPIYVSAFIDSGANTEFISHQYVKSVGIELIPSTNSHKDLALDDHALGGCG